jgi:hypothetical protein
MLPGVFSGRSLLILVSAFSWGNILLPALAQAQPLSASTKFIAQSSGSKSSGKVTDGGFTDRRITKAEISNILDSMRVATEARNIEGVTLFMLPFISSDNKFVTPYKTEFTRVQGKSQHQINLLNEFSGTKRYKHHGYGADITVSPDGKYAIATEKYLLEVETNTGDRVLFPIAANTRFIIFNGEPMIISTANLVEMESPIALRLPAKIGDRT